MSPFQLLANVSCDDLPFNIYRDRRSVRATVMVVQVGEESGVCEWNALMDVVR